MGFQIQFRGAFGGQASVSGWAPAITGTLNQTGEPDAEASTFATHDEAESVLDNVIRPTLSDAESDGAADHAPTFRIVEV